MMDIIERLRSGPEIWTEGCGHCEEAANEIEHLRENLTWAISIMEQLEVRFSSAELLMFYRESIEKLKSALKGDE